MSVEYYYVNDLNRLYNAAVGDKTDGDEHHVRMIEAHDNLKAYVQKLEHWKDTALQLSRNNGEAQAKIKALEADYVISNRELLIKQVEIARLTAELAELREKTRWIPVSERLPDHKQSVLAVADRFMAPYCNGYDFNITKRAPEIAPCPFCGGECQMWSEDFNQVRCTMKDNCGYRARKANSIEGALKNHNLIAGKGK